MESQIENLKRKYWKAETTVEEERILKAKGFKNKDLESAYFSQLNDLKYVESNITFSIPKKNKSILWKFSSIAATIVILIAFAIGFNNYEKASNQFVVEDPQRAYEISQQALLLLSSKFNKGVNYSNRIDKINEVKKTVNK